MRQPDEDQMEYIVGQFEAMASYLTTPDAQSNPTVDHFPVEHAHGLGIREAHKAYENAQGDISTTSAPADEAYIAHVGNYISSVQNHIENLKMRLDEAKTLNSIQLDVIDDLRRQMKSVRLDLQSELSPRLDKDNDNGTDNEDDKNATPDHEADAQPETPSHPFGHDSWETIDPAPSPIEPTTRPIKYKRITILRDPPRRSFWSSFAEALDSFAYLFLEDAQDEEW